MNDLMQFRSTRDIIPATMAELKKLDRHISEFVFHSARGESDYCDNYWSMIGREVSYLKELNPPISIIIDWIDRNIKNKYEAKRLLNVLFLGPTYLK